MSQEGSGFVVGQDQICAVAGTSISDNVHLFRIAFDFVKQKVIRCALIKLDQLLIRYLRIIY